MVKGEKEIGGSSTVTHSCQVVESNNEDNIKMVDEPLAEDESRPSIHATKCGLCEKNKWLCVGLPGQTCNKYTRAKAWCDKSLGWIGRRKRTKMADAKGKATGE